MSFGEGFGGGFGGPGEGPIPAPSPGDDVIGRFRYVGDYVQRELRRLLRQFHGRPRLESIIRVCAYQVQEIENAIWQVVYALDIDRMEGAQLDMIGKIVKLPRDGREDDVYRLLLRVEIRVLRSRGRDEDLITIIGMLLDGGPFEYEDTTPLEPATAIADLRGVAIPFSSDLVLRTLRRAKAAGTKLWIYYSPLPPEATFTFADNPSPDPDEPEVIDVGQGFGDNADPSVGGCWASAMY